MREFKSKMASESPLQPKTCHSFRLLEQLPSDTRTSICFGQPSLQTQAKPETLPIQLNRKLLRRHELHCRTGLTVGCYALDGFLSKSNLYIYRFANRGFQIAELGAHQGDRYIVQRFVFRYLSNLFFQADVAAVMH